MTAKVVARWVERFQAEGSASMVDHSSQPKTSPSRTEAWWWMLSWRSTAAQRSKRSGSGKPVGLLPICRYIATALNRQCWSMSVVRQLLGDLWRSRQG
ncbi:hypothetical protein C7I87_32985 [Mesorhizobium sp. SARCC-RB16n]|nr:hypothetical protein C7I87_32985 [Mesorhizobium sp. SARCC-RB16n]